MPEQSATIAWLLNAQEPWVVYNTLRDLAGADTNSTEAKAAYQAMQAHPHIADLLAALDPRPPADRSKGAYEPKEPLWKLATLADFGLTRDDGRVAALAERIFAAQAEDGGFLNGGFDHTKSWDTRPYICISHVMTYALARFGYLDDPRLERAYQNIAAWQRGDGGWHPNKLNLPGGSRKGEPSCPFGTVNVLRAIAVNPRLNDSDVARAGGDYLLECWERRAEPYRPVGFGIGSTWDKLQYPYVQYQLLKEIDTLAQIPAAISDTRFHEMLVRLESKQDKDGRWTVEGTTKIWSEFDFGQKQQPSAWITFLALRAIQRGRGG